MKSVINWGKIFSLTTSLLCCCWLSLFYPPFLCEKATEIGKKVVIMLNYYAKSWFSLNLA